MVYIIGANENVDISKTDGKGCVWKKFVLSFLASLPFFTYGIESLSLSSSAHSGHFIADDGVPWTTTAMVLGAIFSAPIYCYVIDKHGRKVGVYLVNLIQGASCIPLFLPPTEPTIISLHTLAGISSSGLFTILPIYIREISNDGICSSLMIMMTTGGYLMKMVADDEVMMYLVVGLVVVQFIVMVVGLETPSYFVMKGKIELATKSMAKITCLPENHPTVLNEVAKLQTESERARANGRLHLFNILRYNLIWRDATKIGLILYTVTVLGGSILFLDQQKTLQQLHLASDPDNLVVQACLFAGAVTIVILIELVEKRILITLSYVTMVISMGILAVFTQADLTVTSLRWVPVVCHGVLVFAYGMAWGLPIMIMIDMLNFEIRSTILCFIYTYSQIIKTAHLHTFKYLEEYIGIFTLCYIFCAINLYGAVYALFCVPEFRSKTIRQIEKQLKRPPLL